ncbi:hypothetical protein OBBRIDRAFT_290514 [Obba rivulosa]|uniref:Uncharacterized protein n=1 Tax=Obba rivulosa TaxID=1052685 RepID=A0A8E2DPU7_9APHY|nr:hypothetical protein OBBRIDRAFT_290514 [Obba rivulosa]
MKWKTCAPAQLDSRRATAGLFLRLVAVVQSQEMYHSFRAATDGQPDERCIQACSTAMNAEIWNNLHLMSVVCILNAESNADVFGTRWRRGIDTQPDVL